MVKHSKPRNVESNGVKAVHFEERIEILGVALKMVSHRETAEDEDDGFLDLDVKFILIPSNSIPFFNSLTGIWHFFRTHVYLMWS